jgi:hypothetical protein
MLPNGQPAIAFRSNANSTSDLYYTFWNGSEWETTYVDVMGDTGHKPCLAIAPDGLPAISFLDYNQYKICLAKYVPRPASPVQMDSNYAAYAETEWSAPVTTTIAGALGRHGLGHEPQGTAPPANWWPFPKAISGPISSSRARREPTRFGMHHVGPRNHGMHGVGLLHHAAMSKECGRQCCGHAEHRCFDHVPGRNTP